MSSHDARAGDPPLRTNWFAVSVVVLASVTAAFQIGKAPAALPAMQADLGLTLEEGVWIISIFISINRVRGNYFVYSYRLCF
mgnify:CR=1 FL=1